MAPLVSWFSAAFAVAATAEPVLRGATPAVETEEAEDGNVTGFATGLWGRRPGRRASCARYGCERPYQIGQLCGCWPGCRRFRICCADYDQVCSAAPTPAPAPPRPPAPAPEPAPGPAPAPPAPTPPSDGELFTFYMYRAQSDASYPPKNVNAGNLPGVMWYLQNEVVTENPPKFGISRILRYKVQYKAPAPLLAKGMNFGVRYAYDSQECTGPGDCQSMYRQYGYFAGCNNFASMYPYPDKETHYSGGVWYSFPGEGACGAPTGAGDCTYSYSWPPEEISLAELAAGDGEGFWAHPDDEAANSAKVRAAAALFASKYPDSTPLAEPACDFDFSRFWH